jgi:hypothetical protein
VSLERQVNFGRREDLTSLYRDSLRLYARYLGVWLAIGAGVAVPVDLIVSGLGLGRLTGPYRADLSVGALAVETAAAWVVSAPLVSAMTVHGILDARRGRRPRALAAIRSGVEAYPRLLPPIVIAALVSAVGLVLLVIPGLYFAVRWYFVPQAVLVDERAEPRAALDRSAELVRGSWWRVFGIGVLTLLVALLPVLLVGGPFEELARATGRDAYSLIGGMVVETFIGPWVAIVATLLYLDLRERRQRP